MSKTFDLSSFSGWSSLVEGTTYSIQLSAIGDPLIYKESDLSTGVNVTKPYPPIILDSFTLDTTLTSLVIDEV